MAGTAGARGGDDGMDGLEGAPRAGVSADGTFRIFSPVRFFEKADAPEGQRRRIAGIATTDSKDADEERVLQRGLDFQSYFLKYGWYNDNHARHTGGAVGYPTGVKFFRKGERLPDGTVAPSNLHWSEGYLLPTKRAQEIWDLGQALAKAGHPRRLGQSIEGKVLRRSGPGGKIIASALVRNIALTHCPVNSETTLSFLSKALTEAEAEDVGDGDEDKLDTQGKPGRPPARVARAEGARAGAKAASLNSESGAALRRESLEGDSLEEDERPGGDGNGGSDSDSEGDGDSDSESTTKGQRELLGRSEALAVLRARFPGLGKAEAERMLGLIQANLAGLARRRA